VFSMPEHHFALYHAQGVTLGAIGAQPEVFNSLVFCLRVFCMKAKKSATVEAHQRFGALRIGTLRDHESVAAAYVFRRSLMGLCRLQSQAPVSRTTVLLRLVLAVILSLTGNSFLLCRKLTFAGEKLRVSAVQSSITCLLSIPALAIHVPYSHMETEQDSLHMEKIILPPKESRKKTGPVPFLSGEMVPVSGIWRPDHTRCPNSGDIWLRKQTPFPPCFGCSSSTGFALIEEVQHISEDPDFQ
jgi:hypothetical protein